MTGAINIYFHYSSPARTRDDDTGTAHDPKSGRFTSGSAGGHGKKEDKSKSDSGDIHEREHRARAAAHNKAAESYRKKGGTNPHEKKAAEHHEKAGEHHHQAAEHRASGNKDLAKLHSAMAGRHARNAQKHEDKLDELRRAREHYERDRY